MARKSKTNAKNSGPKGPVVIEEAVEDAVEVAEAEMPQVESTGDVTRELEEALEPASEAAAEDSSTDVEPDAEAPEEPAEDDTAVDAPEEDTAADPVEPEPAPVVPSMPAPEVTIQKVGFVPLVLGGVIAAALGFGAAWLYLGGQDTTLSDQIAAQSSKISELEAQIAAIPTEPVDLSGIDASIAQTNEGFATLTARVDEISGGIATDVAAFDARLTEVERAPSVDGTLAATAIASWERELDTLRAEIAAQQDRMQGIATTAEAELEATRTAAAQAEQDALAAAEQAIARAALARVQVALDSGTAFDAALADLTDAGVEAPAALADFAAEGVPTTAALEEAFPAVARAALAAARASGEADADSNPVTAFLRNQFDVRSVAPREGDDPDAILSRVGAALAENRLTDALAEVESLPEVSRVEMSAWIDQAEARTAAMAAVESLDQSMNN